jgi:nucleoside-diphosphate-sugar epimerase
MKVFVIGASGFVGSHVARRYVEAGHHVTGLSRSESSDAKLGALGISPIRGDAESVDSLMQSCRDADTTIFAPQLLLEPEQQAVKAILAALEGTGKPFIFTSGTGVLSQSTGGAWSEDSFGEDDPFTPYAPMRMRVETENLVRAAGHIVIRPPLIWGNNGCNIIQQLHKSIQKTGDCCYVGAGLNLYSNVHIMDLVEVYAAALSKGVPGALYHAVSGELNYRLMAESLAKANNVQARSVTVDEAHKIWGKFATGLIFAACSRSRAPRTRKELGWSPRYLDVAEMFTQPAA